MLKKVKEVIDRLKGNNSATEKLNILSEYKTDKDIVKFFQYCYDSTRLYGASSKNIVKYWQNYTPNYIANFDQAFDLFELCDELNSRKYTGNAALEKIITFIDCNRDYEELLLNFFDRNMKIGVAVTQLNKAFGNVIHVYEVPLAQTYDEKKHDKYNLTDYFIQRKCDGIRSTTFIQFDKKTNSISVKTMSRNGKEYTTLQKVVDEIVDLYKKSPFYGVNTVIDGEVCLIDEDGKEDWNGIVSEARRKDYTVENPRYIMFDILTEDEFFGIRQSMNYSVRYSNLKKFMANGKDTKHLMVIFSVPYTNENFERLKVMYVDNEKWEGFIFRKNCPFKSGRSTDLLKYKLFKDAEFVVTGTINGEKLMLNNKGVMENMNTCAALTIEYKGHQCQVGSGLSDEQRRLWFEHPEEIIGKVINVKYKQESHNQDGSVSLQFPVLKMVIGKERDF